MKSGIEQIIGKTVAGVVVADSHIRKYPDKHIFITFTDDTFFEIYGENFSGASGLETGGLVGVENCVKQLGASITATYVAPPASA
jgi:hypothetical protein